jgi:serine/threonine protein kinase
MDDDRKPSGDAKSDARVGVPVVDSPPRLDRESGAEENFPPVEGSEFPSTLGKFYRVTRQIGEGGMGVVFEVEHTKMGKKFAAKVISKFFASDRDAVRRFELEAIAASKIESPHIVQVVHLDTEGEYTYIIMELLRGKNLATVIHKKVMPVPLAVEIAKQVARGLIAAHEAGIVHRDLKPENIFLISQDGQLYVKILDFGISKIKHGPDANVRLTKTGQIIGTPLYFSPEQARGIMEVDGRTDIYALGVILFEMVTGQPVFDAKNPIDLMMKHATEAPQLPTVINPAVPDELERIILKCLAKDVKDRYQNASELHDDLAALQVEPLARETVVSATTTTDPLLQITDSSRIGLVTKKKSSGSRIALAAVLVAVVLIAAAAVWYFMTHAWKGPGGDVKQKTPPGQVFQKIGAGPQGGQDAAVAGDAAETAPRDVTLTITSTPSKAEVWIDDKLAGQTPFIYKAPGDGAEHAFELRARGYKPETVVIKAEGDEARHVALSKVKKGVKIDIKTEQ